MPIDPANIVKFSYAHRMRDLATTIEIYSRDGTPIPEFHQAARHVMLALGELLVEMAAEIDAKLAAMPATREHFAQPRETGRNPFGY
jgi:hypothetical protein